MNLFVNESFTSHSGLVLPWKIECDALSDDDIATFARIAHEQMGLPWGSIGAVVAVGERGPIREARHAPTRLARALRRYIGEHGWLALLVDDVYTTGRSLEEEAARHQTPLGLVLFARKPTPEWIKYIWALNPSLR